MVRTSVRRASDGVRALAALAIMALSSCAAAGVRAPGLVRSTIVDPDDRVVIRQHTTVLGVAASARRVFMLSEHGLVVYDRLAERWTSPSSQFAGELALAGIGQTRAVVMAADPFEDAVWIGVPGAVVQVRTTSPERPDIRRTAVGGIPEVIAFARGDAGRVLVRASGQWTEVSRAGFATPVTGGVSLGTLVLPVQLEDVYREYPALRGQLPFLLREPGMGSAPRAITAATVGTLSPDSPSEAWIGTRANGLWRVDANFMQASPLRFGLLNEDVGALAIGANGVWSVGQGREARSGLSFTGADLQTFAWVETEAGIGRGLPVGAAANALAVRAGSAWVGTDRGLVGLALGTGRRTSSAVSPVRTWGTPQGLPDERVLSLVARTTGVWVGTARGLAFVSDSASASGEVIRPTAFAGDAVRALAVAEEVLFVGTDRGLFAMSAADPSTTDLIASVRAVAAGAGGVRALAWSDSVLLVVTTNGAHLLPRPRTLARAMTALDLEAGVDSAFGVTRAMIADLGPVVAADMDDRAIWLAGARGVIAWPRDGGVARWLPAGSELPGDVTALVLESRWAWVGTRAGLVRIARAADGALP